MPDVVRSAPPPTPERLKSLEASLCTIFNSFDLDEEGFLDEDDVGDAMERAKSLLDGAGLELVRDVGMAAFIKTCGANKVRFRWQVMDRRWGSLGKVMMWA